MAPACKEVKTKSYQTRKSPPYHAGDCRGLTKKGGDGANWTSQADSRGVYKWIKKAHKTLKLKKPVGRMYNIHDNGGTPFRAFVTKDHVTVHHMDYDWDADTRSLGPIAFESVVKKVYIGEDHMRFGYQPMTASNKGNSILVQKDAKTYVFIGWKIQSFQPVKGDEIIGYESPIGNNDVPYPFAVGKEYTYLLLEEKYVPNSLLDMKVDPYVQYYGFGGKYPEVKKASKKLSMKSIVGRVN